MRCDKTARIMTYLILTPSSNTSAVSCCKKMEVRHSGNLLHRVHLKISNVCNFLISERKHKVVVVIFLDNNEHYGTEFNVFF